MIKPTSDDIRIVDSFFDVNVTINEIEVTNNFIDKDDANSIHTAFQSNEFPWYYVDDTVKVSDDRLKNYIDNQAHSSIDFISVPFFRHSFIKNATVCSDYFNLIEPLITKIKEKFNNEIIFTSVYGNCLLSNPTLKNTYSFPHVDVCYDKEFDSSFYDSFKTYTAIFYLNNGDDKTIVYNNCYKSNYEERYLTKPIVDLKDIVFIENKNNRLILFDSKRYHSAPNGPKNTRMIINLNFYEMWF